MLRNLHPRRSYSCARLLNYLSFGFACSISSSPASSPSLFCRRYISVNRYQAPHRHQHRQQPRPPRPPRQSLPRNLLPLPRLHPRKLRRRRRPRLRLRARHPRQLRSSATLRLSSLWSRRVEFSTHQLHRTQRQPRPRSPTANGTSKASSSTPPTSTAAPTAQKPTPVPAPRFPYIEATDARVNIKSGLEKLPFSLTEADFALWLPQPSQWRVRISGKPTRTDTSASDTGLVSLEGTLGRAERFDLIPIELAAEWKNVPLGEASRVLTGDDAGVRGELRLSGTLRGTVGTSVLKTSIDLRGLRRADFVPNRPINLRADCQATTADTFHALHEIRCSWPPPGDPTLLALHRRPPSLHDPASASFQLGTPACRRDPPAVAPRRQSSRLTGANRHRHPDGKRLPDSKRRTTHPHLPAGSFSPALNSPKARSAILQSPSATPPSPPALCGGLRPRPDRPRSRRQRTRNPRRSLRRLRLRASPHWQRAPIPSPIPWRRHPQFGDGLPALFLPPSAPQPPPSKELPIHVDLTSIRTWNGGQSWSRTTPTKPTRPTNPADINAFASRTPKRCVISTEASRHFRNA